MVWCGGGGGGSVLYIYSRTLKIIWHYGEKKILTRRATYLPFFNIVFRKVIFMKNLTNTFYFFFLFAGRISRRKMKTLQLYPLKISSSYFHET